MSLDQSNYMLFRNSVADLNNHNPVIRSSTNNELSNEKYGYAILINQIVILNYI
jgi:hypothetical protein